MSRMPHEPAVTALDHRKLRRNRRLRRSALILSLTALPACAWANSTEPPPEVDQIAAHARFLADDLLDGRGAGTIGYDVAALYASTRFAAFGLEPGGASGSFLQPVPLFELHTQEQELTLVTRSKQTPLRWKDDFLAGASPVHLDVDFEAPVVFVGYGVEAPELGVSDYKGVDVAGKIVLMLSGAPSTFPGEQQAHHAASRTKAEVAVRHGAVGVLSMRTRAEAERSPWERMTLNPDRPSMYWRHPDGRVERAFPSLRVVAALSEEGARSALATARVDWNQLQDQVAAGKHRSRSLDLVLRSRLRGSTTERPSSNVVAVLPGSDPALVDEWIVCTAHLDHVGPGAAVDGDSIYNGYWDNAIGSAIVLEMARLLAAGPRPARSIAFVLVTAEEKGLLGSDYFAQYPGLPKTARIVANVNLDMPLMLGPVADIIAFGGEHSDLGEVAARVAAAHGFTLSPDPMPEEAIFVRSDQYSFVRQGIPAIYLDPGESAVGGGDAIRESFRAFLREHYHRPSDEGDLLPHWDTVGRFTAVNLDLVRDLATRARTPAWKPGNFFAGKFARPAATATPAPAKSRP